MSDPIVIDPAMYVSKIEKPGLYHDVPEAIYHADPCPEPSLSHSVAVALLDRSPAHAYAMHPRFGGESEFETDSKMDIGKAIHAGLTRTPAALAIVDAPDWRTKAAKDQRASAHAEGKVPLLRHQFEDVRRAIDTATAQIQTHPDIAPHWFEDAGLGEQTRGWREARDGVAFWCRARIDWLPAVVGPFYDLKTTAGSADPDTWSKRLFDGGYDVQAAFYRRGLRAVGFRDVTEARFVVLEQSPPHALSVIALDPHALAMAEEKVERALDLWAHCLKTGAWPGYPNRICYAEAKPWQAQLHAERQDRARFARETGGHIAADMLHWQKPAGRSLGDGGKGEVA